MHRLKHWLLVKQPEQVRAEGTAEWLVPHRVFDGNRPSNMIMADRLTPEILGKFVALYEHSAFTQSVIWNIDAFDQWGVELGKVLAQRIIPEIENSGTIPEPDHDGSTNNLIRRYLKKQYVTVYVGSLLVAYVLLSIAPQARRSNCRTRAGGPSRRGFSACSRGKGIVGPRTGWYISATMLAAPGGMPRRSGMGRSKEALLAAPV